MPTAKGRYPRHRPRYRGARLHGMRVYVFRRDDFRCRDCGLQFTVPDDYDGSWPPMIYIPVARTPSTPLPWRVIRLELGHIISWLDGGLFDEANLKAQCSPCNTFQGRKART